MSAPVANIGVRSLFTGYTRLSKALSAILAIGFLVTYLIPSAGEVLLLKPGKTIPYAWNLVTAGYTETTVINLLFSIFALLIIGKFIEPIWGSKEFLKFILVVNFLTALNTFALTIALYYSTLKDEYLYAPLCGFHGVIAGFLVALKQLMPEQELITLSTFNFRAKWLPSVAVLSAVILCAALGQALLYLPFIIFGTFNAWLYLRFYQKKAEGNLKGDPSDEFAFATFFPEFIRPVVQVVANIVGKCCCARRPPSQSAADDQGGFAANKPLPGSDPAEASRRRERGARALEERLGTSKAPEAGSSSDASAVPLVPAETTADEIV
eukprot:jgi/Mesen1/8398/ME000468S07827